MKVLSGNDYLEVKTASLIADYDREILANLYQPIFGYAALSAYFSLLTESNNQKVGSIITHEVLLARMQMPAGVFVDARKLLEACGLLKTFVEATDEMNIYHYELYAPKTPELFFGNVLLYGMLIKCIGESEANKLRKLYVREENVDYGEDISANFQEVFHPDYDDNAFVKASLSKDDTIGRNSYKIRGEFTYERFFESLSKVSQITSDGLSKKEMKEVARLATLYGVDEAASANIVASLYDPTQSLGKRIDFEKATKLFQDETYFAYMTRVNNKKHLVSGKTDLSQKINLMESVSPRDYLSVMQGGTNPASADLNLVDALSKQFGLANCVINVLVDFVLSTNNNVLSKPLCEKIAASLAREGLQTAVDAMNYLKKTSSNKPVRRSVKKININNDNNESSNNEVSENKEEELNWNQLLDDIDEGGSDGKA